MSDFNLYDPVTAKRVKRADRWDRLLKLAIVIALIAFSLLQVYNTSEIRQTQTKGTPTGKAILETNEQIKSCLDVTGSCYKRSQDNQIAIINTFTDRTVYAISCGQKMPDAPVREVLKCVDKLVAQEK